MTWADKFHGIFWNLVFGFWFLGFGAYLQMQKFSPLKVYAS